MTDTLTTAKSLTVQTIGGNSNTWGAILNNNTTAIDQALGQTLTKAITGDATLIAGEAVYIGYEFTGALTADAAITFPTFQGPFFIRNQTTGGFSLTLGMATGGTVTVPASADSVGFSDGTDFFIPGTAPTGAAGGDLSGTYPNPSVSLADPLPLLQGGTGQATALAAFSAIVTTAASIAPAGSITFKNGLIIKWAAVAFGGGSSVAVTFPGAFPTSLYGVVLSSSDTLASLSYSATSLSGFTFNASKVISGSGFWIAIGN